MAEITLVEAVNLALARAMQDDPEVVVLGQDVGLNGGVFRATVGLQQRFGAVNTQYDSTFYSAFVQDDWQVTPNLKVLYGVRYDLFDVPNARPFAANKYSSSFTIDKNNFGPRAGLSWSIDGTGRTVLRASVGLMYEPPLLEEPAASFVADGFQKVIGLVLAPHSSSMSTDQYMTRAAAELSGTRFTPITQWWDAPGFSELIARRVHNALATIPAERRDQALVLFSAHSLPERILTLGDTYPDQLRQSAHDVAAAAGVEHMDIAWQSAGRTPEPWIGPDILDVIRAKANDGITDIVSCPIGFVSDHLEVLYDIDIEAQAVAREVGVTIVRTASLNDDADFMSFLAGVVLSHA